MLVLLLCLDLFRNVTAVAEHLVIKKRSTTVEVVVKDFVMSVLNILNLYQREAGVLILLEFVRNVIIYLQVQ